MPLCALQALFRRAQLKALVTMHSIEENFGGHLSATEINIIGGALDLTNKTAAHGMTPLDKVHIMAGLDQNCIHMIMRQMLLCSAPCLECIEGLELQAFA